MNRVIKFLKASIMLCILSAASLSTSAAVDVLRVEGNQVLVGNEAKSLAGNSLFWSNDYWGGEKFYNAGVVTWLKHDWNSQIIRAAMGVDEDGGYLEEPEKNKQRVIEIVESAIANDMYVIIDWHSHHAELYPQQAIEFFREMATLFGEYDNVIYEIYNEPLKVSWSNVIKPYAESVIRSIREIDSDNLILVGTPNWSQYVDEASRDQITGYDNIAYVLHFYAAGIEHQQSLRERAQIAMDNGAALFVTEWGAVEPDGNGFLDKESTQQWLDFLAEKNISHVNWAINDKLETSSVLREGSRTSGAWFERHLTDTGVYIRDILKNWDDKPSTSPAPTPSTDTCANNAINFNTVEFSDFSDANIRDNFEVSSNGCVVALRDNTWKMTDVTHKMTLNTVLEFEFRSSSTSEIHGFGLETKNPLQPNSDRTFRLFGTQKGFGIFDYRYNGSGNYQKFSIPVGLYFSGYTMSLYFVMDGDETIGGDSFFRNVRFVEKN